MKNLVILLAFCCFAAFLPAQPTIEWQKALGGSYFDEAKSIQITLDGGFIVAGITASSDDDVVGFHGVVDFWVVKLSASGSVQWTKAFGGSDDDRAYAVRQAYDGG